MKKVAIVAAAFCAVCAARAVEVPDAQWTALTNKVEVLWTGHTNRIARAAAIRARGAANRGNVNGQRPVRPFRAKKFGGTAK